MLSGRTFIWAWIYYGEIFPNTVAAKSTLDNSQFYSPGGLVRTILQNYPATASTAFLPIYESAGGWPSPVMDAFGIICGIISAEYG